MSLRRSERTASEARAMAAAAVEFGEPRPSTN
jgi:hypothetical protein